MKLHREVFRLLGELELPSGFGGDASHQLQAHSVSWFRAVVRGDGVRDSQGLGADLKCDLSFGTVVNGVAE